MNNNNTNISFNGFFANQSMKFALNSYAKRTTPKVSIGGMSVSLYTPNIELASTENVLKQVEKFIQSKPNKNTFAIVEKIREALPKVGDEFQLVKASTGEQHRRLHPQLKTVFAEISKKRNELHDILDNFVKTYQKK